MDTSLRKNLFVIPLPNGKNIVYAPLHGAAFFANEKAASLCKAYISGFSIEENAENQSLVSHIKLLEGKNIHLPSEIPVSETSNNLVVILSQMCNLACSYCFAQEARSKDILSQDKLKTAIDYVFDKESKKIHLSFIGGGEPTLTWDLLSWAITYARGKDLNKNRVSIGVTTNGTLLNDSMIDFLKENDIHIGLSFEILPNIQNKQRCFTDKKKNSFDIINTVVNKLITRGVYLSFRSTITQYNVKLMCEMVNFVIENYPKVKRLHFEQVTSTDLNKTFYDDFIYYFIEARKLGEINGIEVCSSVTKSFNTIKSKFCKGELCLTPTGDIVACHRISSSDDPAFDLFTYAKVEDGMLSLDLDKKERIEKFNGIKRDGCSSCFAKWHCAGSCSMEKTIYTNKMRDLKCYFFKELIKKLLIERLGSVSP